MGLYAEQVLPRIVDVACTTGLDVCYEKGAPKVLGANSLGVASPA